MNIRKEMIKDFGIKEVEKLEETIKEIKHEIILDLIGLKGGKKK